MGKKTCVFIFIKSNVDGDHQVMEAETGPAVLHTVSGLLRFYVTTMADVVGDTALMETLRDLDGQCRSTCLAALEASASRLVERLAPPPADLGPSAVLSPTLQLLRDVLSGGRIADAGADDVARVVERTVRPLLDAVQRTAARLPVVDQAAYTLNCLYQVCHTPNSIVRKGCTVTNEMKRSSRLIRCIRRCRCTSTWTSGCNSCRTRWTRTWRA